jgi:hypothetical protein
MTMEFPIVVIEEDDDGNLWSSVNFMRVDFLCGGISTLIEL